MAPLELATPPVPIDWASGEQSIDDVDLTLLVCTHNHAGLLDRALQSIAAQAVPRGIRWEVLVVDNRCTDGTREVVRRWAADPRIPVLRSVNEPHLGVSFARKRGIRESRGRLIGFVDDDCLLAPDWVARALGFAEAHP